MISSQLQGEKASDQGLCVTCRLVDECAHRRSREGPILECELFEEGPTPAAQVAALVDKHAGRRGGMIAILEGIQAKYGYLPEDALKVVAGRTGRSLVEVYGMATFYRAFSLRPRGKHLCSVCVGTACHVRGAPAVEEEVERQLGVKPGETTGNREFTLETVNCLGACALGPVVVVDGHYFPAMGPRKVADVLEKTRGGLDYVELAADKRVFPLEVCCPRCNHSLMDPQNPIDGHPSVRVTISFERKHGWLRLSSLYGSYSIESEHEIPYEIVADFFCPFCHAELLGASDCPSCSAPLVPLIVRGGAMVQICSRRGCKTHMLDVTGTSI